MQKLLLLTVVVLIGAGVLVFYVARVRQMIPSWSFNAIHFDSDDRILILAPHPDDEVLGCGGVIQKALDLDIPVKVVFLTYGDNNQWSFLIYRKHPVIMPESVKLMGLVRHDETIRADRVLGLLPNQLIFLGYPDFRTLNIWYSHWGDRPAARSMLTEVKAVPYANAYRPGAPYKGEEIVQDLETIIHEFKPTKIFVSHSADYNPDHKALYLFTRVALWNLEDEIDPKIYPYLVHYPRWPNPKGYSPGLSLIPPAAFQNIISWFSLGLSPDEVELKYRAIQQHRSQYDASKRYLLSFMRSNEPFGDFEPISLIYRSPQFNLTSETGKDSMMPPEELVDEERALFVGIEKHSVVLTDDSVVINTILSRPLGNNVGISMHIFGYRSDRDFKDMPKLNIKFGVIEQRILDQDCPLPKDAIEIVRKPRKIVIRVPLAALGNPQRILTSARTYTGKVPLDWTSWRVLKLTK